MSEQMKKLVEEIARMVYRPSTGCSWDWKEGRERARGAIVRTLAAVRDGLEIPGEETRIKGCYISELGGYRDIIVFREEEKRR